MKKLYILLFLFLLLFSNIQAQVGQRFSSTCIPSPLLLRTYQYELKGLAIRHLYEINSPDTVFIDIPQKHIDSVAERMAAICNLDAPIRADSVFRKYCIHNDEDIYRAEGGEIKVYLDISYSWTDQWLDFSKIKTGYSELDNFIARYGFKTVKPYNYFIVTISNNRQINFKAFADSLTKFGGVIKVDIPPRGIIPESVQVITYSQSTVGHKFGFFASREPVIKAWYYTVYDDCSVSLDSAVSVSHPAYIGPGISMPNCNLFPVEIAQLESDKLQIKVYPNPANDVLHITTGPGNYEYSIIDIYGRTVNKGSASGYTVINIQSLATGTYVVQVVDIATGNITNSRVVKF